MDPAGGATYRVQLHAGFPFAAAARLAPYLAELGVTHLYCSPVLQAAPGSTHGYDVVDPGRLSAELGGEDGFAALVSDLRAAGLGVVLDIVPNHMATAGRANAWWWDVLENGPASRWSSYFDIDWDPPESKLRQRVLVPVLASHYGRVLEAGDIRLTRQGGSFALAYFDHEVPVSPRTLDALLADAADRHPDRPSAALAELAASFGTLPLASSTDRAAVAERHRDKEYLAGRLRDLCASDPAAAAAVDAAVDAVNADTDLLDELVQRQNYRLAYWRVAGHELDYRRFFDIPGLIALRTERPEVFDDSHALLGRLVRDGAVDGVRVDHPDGLREPRRYLERLAGLTGGAWVVVEKILEEGESLRAGWRTAGTTGYEFLNVAGGLLVDPAGEAPLTDLYRRFTGDQEDFEVVARAAKQEVMATSLAADVERLTALLADACEADRCFRDYTRSELRGVLVAVLAAFGVYRTYLEPGEAASPEDGAEIEGAVARARELRPDLEEELFGFVSDVLAGRRRSPTEAALALRFQQVSGPVMAKGVEDTAFYRYCRLLALNEVGGDPGRFGHDLEAFHSHNTAVAERWPATLLSTSTHDTKRSEDVRCRLALLSEIPTEWSDAVARWSRLAERHWSEGPPDPWTEYTLFQTLVGAHPIDAGRATAYLVKAAREAKVRTSWTDQDAVYEAALEKLVGGLLADAEFTADLEAFVEPLVGPGRVSSLALTLLKLTSPGVADIYQGCEGWDLSLVDPDNRRPVDHDRLAALVAGCAGLDAAGALARADEGLPKLFLIRHALHLRRRLPAAFGPESTYQPLWATGPRAAHAVALARSDGVVAVAPRLVLGLSRAGWGETTLGLPAGPWHDLLTGARWEGTVALSDLLAGFPVALLCRPDLARPCPAGEGQ